MTVPAPPPSAVAAVRAQRGRLDDLPRPGSGRTLARWEALADLGRGDLSVARLAEGHVDATAILDELGHPIPTGVLGVWAADPAALEARPTVGGWCLVGEKGFCSGSTGVDIALVAATAPDGARLFLVDPSAPGVSAVPDSWRPMGMEDSASDTLRFADVLVEEHAAVGAPGAYVDRPGFGHGGCGVAAVWWGGAAAVLDGLRSACAADDVAEARLIALGEATAALEAAWAALAGAAAAIDAGPTAAADHLALVVRMAVGQAAQVVLDRTTRALGARGLCHDPAHARRVADLTVYLAQLNPDRSAAALGRAAVDRPWRLAP